MRNAECGIRNLVLNRFGHFDLTFEIYLGFGVWDLKFGGRVVSDRML